MISKIPRKSAFAGENRGCFWFEICCAVPNHPDKRNRGAWRGPGLRDSAHQLAFPSAKALGYHLSRLRRSCSPQETADAYREPHRQCRYTYCHLEAPRKGSLDPCSSAKSAICFCSSVSPCSPCPPWCNLSLLQVFKDAGCAHAAADTHGHHTVACVAAFEFADDARRQLGAGTTQRMPQRDRPAVDVDARGIEMCFLDDGQRLGGEGLVQLDHINVVELESGHLQRLRDREDWANAHLLGFVTCGCKCDVASQRFQPQCFRALG